MSRRRAGPGRSGGGRSGGGRPGGTTARLNMTRFEAGTDPLAGVERVYVDGSNVVHALAGRTGPGSGGGMLPPAALVAGLRAAFPAGVLVELVFDGPPAGGLSGRLTTGFRVSFSGRRSADRLIEEGVIAQLAADGPASTWGLLVVTDDRALRDAVAARGARTAGTAWLAGRLGRLPSAGPPAPAGGRGHGGAATTGGPHPPLPKAGASIGHRRPPRPPRSATGDDD